MNRPNAEQEEAAEIERMMQPRLDELTRLGGVFMARKATVDDNDQLTLHYYVAVPQACNHITVHLDVGRLK